MAQFSPTGKVFKNEVHLSRRTTFLVYDQSSWKFAVPFDPEFDHAHHLMSDQYEMPNGTGDVWTF